LLSSLWKKKKTNRHRVFSIYRTVSLAHLEKDGRKLLRDDDFPGGLRRAPSCLSVLPSTRDRSRSWRALYGDKRARIRHPSSPTLILSLSSPLPLFSFALSIHLFNSWASASRSDAANMSLLISSAYLSTAREMDILAYEKLTPRCRLA